MKNPLLRLCSWVYGLREKEGNLKKMGRRRRRKLYWHIPRIRITRTKNGPVKKKDKG